MKLGALFLTGSVLLLAGCSSTTTGSTGPSATPTPGQSSANPAAPTASVAARATVPPPVTKGDAFTRGTADLKIGNYHAAADQFRAAIKEKSHVAASYAGLGAAYAHLNQYPVAYQAYVDAARLEPSNPGYQYNAAYAALYTQNYHSAVTYATQLIKLQPKSPTGYHIRFLAYGSLLNAKGQAKDAEVVAHLSPHDPGAFNDLGIALSNENKYRDSVAAFSKAIALSPNNANYYINRGLAWNLDKQPRKALADLEKARSFSKNPTTIKKLDGAIKVLKKEIG